MNKSDILFLIDRFKKITDSKNFEKPSDYISGIRYLDKELTPMPGYYNFDTTPYWKEPLDMLGPLSPIQKVAIVKGVQIGATTGVLENFVAYNIGSDPKPQLYITADKELAKMGFEIKIERLIDSCGYRNLIFSQTGGKTKKTGDTTLKKEYPGGYIFGIGARNPGKLRSMSFPAIVFDELDGMPDQLKGEGDPVSVADNRTNAYGEKRKILYISTPLIMQTSKIWKLYLEGDQRKFHIPCKHCGEMQPLEWHGITEDGKRYGIIFDIKDGLPVYDSVEYKCKYCGKTMKNHDKSIIFKKGRWIPSTVSKEPGLVSYQINSLYSAPGMFSWEKVVQKWASCWDLDKNKIKDMEKYREFRNLMQGLPFEEKAQSISYDRAIIHRRGIYLANQIPNTKIIQETGTPILFLICSIDIQENGAYLDLKGYAGNGSTWTIDFRFIEGKSELINDEMWKKLENILVNERWVADDGKVYKIINTFIDSGHQAKNVYAFCKAFYGVYPIKGDQSIIGNITYKLFNKETLNVEGLAAAYHINTTKIKNAISSYMNQLIWNTGEFQPGFYPNFPDDFRDDYFKQFSAEERFKVVDKITNRFKKYEWRVKNSGLDNHSFDTYVYNLAALEMFADAICRDYIGLDYLEWPKFWEYCKNGYFYEDVK